VVLAVAACIPSNLGLSFTLVLHHRFAPNRGSTSCSTDEYRTNVRPGRPHPWRPGPTRSGPSSTRGPWHIPTRTRAISLAALHHERCTDRGVSAVLGDTWPTCSLSRGQRCLRDQVDLDTLTAKLLTVVHQTVEPTASCSGCGACRPAWTGQPWPTARTGMVALRSACLLTLWPRDVSPGSLTTGIAGRAVV
jgi:hypothetical protein